ncbi:hypothetical protein M9H77_12973 [Catharanthus roseus]|uniref:Uncharacterized protein n=1 Tax=Catharanthus roseus TaxID=4058 RepID=A0ACC0BJ38_CATRO|nr:hypothetical protein M9H77_12973 [Catharanthus roseus]
MSISHLVATDPEIPVSNIIQEVQVLFQTGCTYKRAWYARKFSTERYSNPRTVYEFLHHKTNSPPNYIFKFFTDCVYATFEQISTRLLRTQPLKIQEKNVDAYIFLMKIDAEKWTLFHDGGDRHGIMATNISEALNSVLKKARVLPLKALVELIFNKLVRENGSRTDTYVPEIYS